MRLPTTDVGGRDFGGGEAHMVRGIVVFAAFAALLILCVPAAANPTFYGYIKLDASLDSAKTNDGDYAYIVLPYPEGDEDNEFNMTAKQTRVGMKFTAPEGEAVDVSGRIEYDFYGGGAENKPNPMLRHAFLNMDFGSFDLLAGQTSDVISPLNPTTLNYIVLWKSGNIGYRRPQIRLSTSMDVGESASLGVAVSANRSMGRDQDGEDTGQPSVQGRVAFGTKLMGGKPATLGVSGALGKETDAVGTEFDQTALCFDLMLPLGDMVTLQGEYFTGKNLAIYLGGVGQGIAEEPAPEETRELATDEIESSGWWGQLTLRPNDMVSLNVGAGTDDPELPDYATSDMIEKNTTYYGNVIWNVTPSAYIGVEYMMLETEYVGTEEDPTSYDDSRVQLSLGYKF